jgi:chromosome segregation ATPase
MKSFQQNLLIVLALGLCLLCAFQWHGQTVQREQINRLNQISYDKSLEIQRYTNSIQTMEHQISQMDGQITELKGTVKTNEQTILDQKRELNKLETQSEALTNEILQYKEATASLETKLKDAYDGVKKQNEAIKQLVVERDDFVKKYNDSVNERNAIVTKYNELVSQVEKLQGTKPGEK